MGFLEKIFGKQNTVEEKPENPEKIEVDLSETGAWLESEISGFLETVNTDASGFIRQITDISENLSKNLDMLEKAESEEEIGSRMKKFAYGNKASFINKVRAFNSKIILPDAKDTLRFYDFFSLTANDINKLTGETVKNIHLAKMLFAEDIKEITDCLNDMADIAHESQKVLNRHKDKLNLVTRAREMLHEIEDIYEMQESGNKRLEQKKQALDKLHDDKKKADQTLHRLEKSEEASKLKQILEQKKDLNTDISKIRSDIFQIFSPLAKVLKKYERFSTGLSPDDEKILAAYIEFPLKAFSLDREFKTLSKITENTEMLINSGKIDLKDKQKQKVLARLNKLKDTSTLGRCVTEYDQLQEQSKNLETTLGSMKINRETETARQNFMDIKGKIESEEQDISRIKKDIESVDKTVSLKTEEMETVLSKISDKDVSVKV